MGLQKNSLFLTETTYLMITTFNWGCSLFAFKSLATNDSDAQKLDPNSMLLCMVLSDFLGFHLLLFYTLVSFPPLLHKKTQNYLAWYLF